MNSQLQVRVRQAIGADNIFHALDEELLGHVHACLSTRDRLSLALSSRPMYLRFSALLLAGSRAAVSARPRVTSFVSPVPTVPRHVARHATASHAPQAGMPADVRKQFDAICMGTGARTHARRDIDALLAQVAKMERGALKAALKAICTRVFDARPAMRLIVVWQLRDRFAMACEDRALFRLILVALAEGWERHMRTLASRGQAAAEQAGAKPVEAEREANLQVFIDIARFSGHLSDRHSAAIMNLLLARSDMLPAEDRGTARAWIADLSRVLRADCLGAALKACVRDD